MLPNGLSLRETPLFMVPGDFGLSRRSQLQASSNSLDCGNGHTAKLLRAVSCSQDDDLEVCTQSRIWNTCRAAQVVPLSPHDRLADSHCPSRCLYLSIALNGDALSLRFSCDSVCCVCFYKAGSSSISQTDHGHSRSICS